jgi:hypothetical protein
MNPANQKKRFRAFAKQLENGEPPTKEQTEYLIHIFRGIADGRDPTRLLGLTYGDGKSKQDETSRGYMDFVMHWIACAIEPDADQNSKLIKPYSMKEAFEEGSKIARRLFEVTDSDSYDPAYIKKKWYQHKKQGKASIFRTASVPDSLYEYSAPDPKE